MSALIECVPNVSEGRNLQSLEAISQAIKAVDSVKLLHIDRGEAANRTVFTFVGPPNNVIEAAFQVIKTTALHIDMRLQKGTHPRIGATDVCPLIPISNISMKEVDKLAQQLGKRVAAELKIPVYLYEQSATTSERKNLATIRQGAYEGLEKKMQLPKWYPDFGKKFNAKSGATVIGARNFLIAYNVNLNTSSIQIARRIAKEIRESGSLVKQLDGTKIRVPGLLKSLKAIGWYIEEYGKAQVSMNLTSYKETGLSPAYEACKMIAQKYKVVVTGSELIGLIPKEAILAAGQFYAKKINTSALSEQNLIQLAIKELGLSEIAPFNYKERILEYLL